MHENVKKRITKILLFSVVLVQCIWFVLPAPLHVSVRLVYFAFKTFSV